jgi:hypothetical protein
MKAGADTLQGYACIAVGLLLGLTVLAIIVASLVNWL